MTSISTKIMEFLEEDIQESMCFGCEYMTKYHGIRGEFGVPLTPDEWECEYGIDGPFEPKCPWHNEYKELERLAMELENALRNEGA